MAVGVLDAWSTTAGSNGSASSAVNFAEGQTPASLNNAARALMAEVKGWANQIGGAKTSGGAANVQTLTSDAVAAISAYAAGMAFVFKAGYSNSGACTLNVDGVGAKSIKKGGAQAALAANDIVAGGIYFVAYEASGDCFVLLNPESGQIAHQPLDATLTALAALSYTSGTLIIRETASDTFELVSDALYAHLAGAETLSGAKTFSAAVTINTNTGSLPSPSSGTLLHTGGADSATPRWFIDGFAATPTWEARRAQGTNASKSAVQATNTLLNIQATGYATSDYSSGPSAAVRFTALENFATGTNLGARGSLHSIGKASTTLSERYRWGDFESTLELGYRDGGPGAVKTADYTFALTDRGTPIDHNSASAHAFLVEPEATVAWPDNSILYGCNRLAGALTIDRGTGVTILNSAGTDADMTVPQYACYMLRKVTTNTWFGRVY